jgi:very-short-patch-repair endonuclease
MAFRIHNNPKFKRSRKELRNNATVAEAILWNVLKKKQVGGLKFRRQHSVGKYILDFYCPSIKLGIELDGAVHIHPGQKTKDLNKEEFLSKYGIVVLRYENKIVFENPERIVDDILSHQNLS